jgi:hypothetical protein
VFVVITGVGTLYFALVQRKKPSHSEALEGQQMAPEAPAAPALS